MYVCVYDNIEPCTWISTRLTQFIGVDIERNGTIRNLGTGNEPKIMIWVLKFYKLANYWFEFHLLNMIPSYLGVFTIPRYILLCKCSPYLQTTFVYF